MCSSASSIVCHFFFVIDVGANILANIAMTWFVLCKTEQEEELVCFSPIMIFIWLSSRAKHNSIQIKVVDSLKKMPYNLTPYLYKFQFLLTCIT